MDLGSKYQFGTSCLARPFLLTKETEFERGASTRQLFMLCSQNVGEARFERCLHMAQSSYLFFLPSYMQLAFGKWKSIFSLLNICPQITPLSYPASLETVSAVELSAVFGAPIFSQLGRCEYITRHEKESQDQYQVLPGPLLFQIQSLQHMVLSAQVSKGSKGCIPSSVCIIHRNVPGVHLILNTPKQPRCINQTTIDQRYLLFSFFPIFVSCCPCNFKQGLAKCVKTLSMVKTRDMHSLCQRIRVTYQKVVKLLIQSKVQIS